MRLIRATLSVMLGDAVDDGIIQTNPASGIGRRGRRSPDSISPADRQKRIRVFTYEQLATFEVVSSLQCSRKNSLLFLLMADAGVLPGKACGLQWTDFDATNRTLRIERSVEDSGRVKAAKTDQSRTVDVSPRLVSALGAFQASLEADAMLEGKRDGISPWVFTTEAGAPPRPHRIAPEGS
jgi:integrase